MSSNFLNANLYVLKVGNGESSSETFTTVAALTNVQLKTTNGKIDVTNKDNAGWQRQVVGMKSVQVTASFMMQTADATQSLLRTHAIADVGSRNYKIVDSDGGEWALSAVISDYTEKGTVNAAMTGDITLDSDGEVSFTPGT